MAQIYADFLGHRGHREDTEDTGFIYAQALPIVKQCMSDAE